MVIILLLMLFIASIKIETPEIEIKTARIALAKAEKNKGSIYKPNLFRSAQQMYDSAMCYWNIENERFHFFRNYSKVKEFAIQSAKLANICTSESKQSSYTYKLNVENKILYLDNIIHLYNNFLATIPVDDGDRKNIIKGKLIFEEAKLAVQNEDYITAGSKVDKADRYFTPVYNKTYNELKLYFNMHPTWLKWIDITKKISKNNKTYCIVIDKIAKEGYLYYKGILKYKFEIELGKNWIGDKNYQGDKTTPEGQYFITKLKTKSQTKYYKAFLLNYPNTEDKNRFELNKKSGKISKNAKIGNLIEIHGQGGKGVDWTDGCIALKDSDMDYLFNYCTIGTKVTIVGSIRSFNEYFQNIN